MGKKETKVTTAGKVSVFGVFLVQIFPHLKLNIERYFVFLRIQSKMLENTDQKTPPNRDTFHGMDNVRGFL